MAKICGPALSTVMKASKGERFGLQHMASFASFCFDQTLTNAKLQSNSTCLMLAACALHSNWQGSGVANQPEGSGNRSLSEQHTYLLPKVGFISAAFHSNS